MLKESQQNVQLCQEDVRISKGVKKYVNEAPK